MREPSSPPRRTYRSEVRAARAARTRRRVLQAATGLFLERGYAATTLRGIGEAAAVSVATVEQLFATKARLLKAAIDVAIAGDDQPIAVLDRGWAAQARAAPDADAFLAQVVAVLVPALQRSAGLVLAVFEGAASDPSLAELRDALVAQRATTAAWIVDALAATAALRGGVSRDQAIDICWVLMDPVVYDRLVRHRGWAPARYGRWFADTLARLLVDASPPQDPSDRSMS